MPSPEGGRPGDARLHLAEAALVAAVALWCVVFQLRLPGELPTEADFAAVKQVLETEGAPGDAVLLFPWWTEHARLFVPEGLPVIGFQGSDTEALPRHGRIWVLAQPHLPGSSWDSFLATFGPQRTAKGPARDFGNLRLQLFENGRYREPKVIASEVVARLSVYLETPSKERRPCTWDGRAHRCAGGYVATEWHETKFQPRHCLKFYPPGGQAKLVAELAGVPAAASATFEAGYVWDRGAFKDPSYTVATFGLEVVGGESRSLTIPPGLETLQHVDLGAVPEGSTVRFSVQSDNTAMREFCVDLTLWGRP